jgi:hypothetical protein
VRNLVRLLLVPLRPLKHHQRQLPRHVLSLLAIRYVCPFLT